MDEKWKFYNVLVLGFAFMGLFTAFQTTGLVEKTVLDGIRSENPSFTGDGNVSLGIIYAVFSLFNWVAPSIVAVIGSKLSMIFGAVLYTLFVVSFLFPATWSLYVCSFLVGIAAAILWTGQGHFLTRNSNSMTMARNSGIFWALLQCSFFIGNLTVYLKWGDASNVEKSERTFLFSVLSGAAGLSIIFFFLLRAETARCGSARVKPSEDNTETDVELIPEENKDPVEALKRSFHLFISKDMLMLSVCIFYTGIELSFFSGIYGAVVSHTGQLGSERKSYIGLCGMAIGFGEISSGLLFSILGKWTIRHGRDAVVLVGFLTHSAAFFIIFLIFPDAAAQTDSFSATYVNPSLALCIIVAFLLGFGDGAFNTQIYSILGVRYVNDSASAFALFKFVQSLAAAISFFSFIKLQLPWQMLIMEIFAILGTVTFALTEWRIHRSNQSIDL